MALYLIPVPLHEEGLSEISLRAKEAISKLKYYLVEDERSARRFLTKCETPIPIQDISLKVIPADESCDDILSQVKEGLDVGVLSEAGTPCVADPGAKILRRAHELGITVHPLAGPSSILMSLAASGLNGQNFAFCGYLPRERDQREASLRKIQNEIDTLGCTQIFIENPHRNDALLESILEICSPSLILCVAIDLTSSKEEIHSYPISAWQKREMKIGKRPAIFLLGK